LASVVSLVELLLGRRSGHSNILNRNTVFPQC
jgi:hypothetical protein